MAWWRRERVEPEALRRAREDLATAHRRREEYEPISREMEKLADAVRHAWRPGPVRPARRNGAHR